MARSAYVDKVRAMLAETPDLTAMEVAARLGCSPHLIYGLARRHGLRLRKPGRDTAAADAFLELVAREPDRSVAHLARETGFSVHYASELVNKAGIRLKTTITPQVRQFLEREARAQGGGATAEQVAAAILADAMHDDEQRRAAE